VVFKLTYSPGGKLTKVNLKFMEKRPRNGGAVQEVHNPVIHMSPIKKRMIP
jgi:hypothetical protein